MRTWVKRPASAMWLVGFAALVVGATGYFAWAGSEPAAAVESGAASGMVPWSEAGPAAAPTGEAPISPESMPLTTCDLGCDGMH